MELKPDHESIRPYPPCRQPYVDGLVAARDAVETDHVLRLLAATRVDLSDIQLVGDGHHMVRGGAPADRWFSRPGADGVCGSLPAVVRTNKMGGQPRIKALEARR